MDVTSITVDKHLKRRLDQLKEHPKESYNDVIDRLTSKRQGGDESLRETIEILSDPETMRSLARSLEQMKSKKRKLFDLDEV